MGPKKDTENDPAWAHGERVGNDRHKVRCKHCNKILSGGGIHRFKCHLGHVSGNTKPCPKVSEEVKEEMRALLQQGGKKRERQEEKKESERIVCSKSKLMIESIPIKTTPVVFRPPHGVTENRVDLESLATSDPSSLPSTSSAPPKATIGTSTTDPSKVASSSSSLGHLPKMNLYQRLWRLVDRARQNWTYAIFWQSSVDVSGASILDWGNGYCKETVDGPERMVTAAEQAIREIYIRDRAYADFDCAEFTEVDWFFFYCEGFFKFAKDPTSLHWQAFSAGKQKWVVGSELAASSHGRLQNPSDYGIQTMVLIPFSNGVVELGSTDMICFCPSEISIWKSILSCDTPANPLSLCSKNKKKEKGCMDVPEEVKEEKSALHQAGKKRERQEEKKESERIVGSKSKLMTESIPIKTTPVVFCAPHGVTENRVDLESSATSEPSSLPSTTSDPSKVSSSSSTMLNSDLYRRRLQSLVDGASENWEYAMFWAWSADVSGVTTVLDGGIGYHREGMDGPKRMVLLSEDTYKSVNVPTSLPWQAFFGRKLIWVVGQLEIEYSSCERVQQAKKDRFLTMVFIPVSNGVVELGSTNEINFCSLEIFDWESIASPDTSLSVCSINHFGRMNHWADVSQVTSDPSSVQLPSTSAAPPTAMIGSSTIKSNPMGNQFRSIAVMSALLSRFVTATREKWVHAIFWRLSIDVSGTSLVWGGGFYNALRDVSQNSDLEEEMEDEELVQNSDLEEEMEDEELVQNSDPEEEMEDRKLVEDFFNEFVDEPPSIVNCYCLPEQELWVAGRKQLEASSFKRANKARRYGYQTMVWIPFRNGVVELGSNFYIKNGTWWTARWLDSCGKIFDSDFILHFS